MTLTEVRIGNWVRISGPKNNPRIPNLPKQILRITEDGEFEFTLENGPKRYLEQPRNCRGINIEHAWLILNRFELNPELNLYTKGNVKLQYFEDIRAYRFYRLDEVISHHVIKYIHEFQNVHKVLTTLEFDVKVSPYTP